MTRDTLGICLSRCTRFFSGAESDIYKVAGIAIGAWAAGDSHYVHAKTSTTIFRTTLGVYPEGVINVTVCACLSSSVIHIPWVRHRLLTGYAFSRYS